MKNYEKERIERLCAFLDKELELDKKANRKEEFCYLLLVAVSDNRTFAYSDLEVKGQLLIMENQRRAIMDGQIQNQTPKTTIN